MRFLTEILAKAGITSNYVQLDTLAATPGGAPGRIVWNDVDGTLEFQMKGGNVTQQIGQELPILVKHADNTGLTNGKVVYQVGSDGTNITVRYASALTENASSKTFGVMTEDASGGAKAFCTTFGLVRDINTSALTEGSIIWLSETAGEMTTTRPTQPANGVVVGRCIRQHATQGVVFVSVQNGFELDELHDVLITSKANNDFIVYESATSLWKNKTIAAVLGYTPANDSNVVKLTGDQTVAGIKTFTSVVNAPTLSLNGGVLAGNNIVSMRSNPTGGQFRIEKSDGSLSAYPFYIGVDGTALAYYYNAAGALKVLLHTNDTSYFGNSLSVGYSTYASTSYMLDVNGTARFVGALTGTSATFTNPVTIGNYDGQALKLQSATSTGSSYLRFYNSAAASRGYLGLFWNGTSDYMVLDAGSLEMNFGSSNKFTFTGGGTAQFSGAVTTAGDVTISTGSIKLYTQQNVSGQYRFIGTEYAAGNGNNKAEIRFVIDSSDTKTKITFHTANGGGQINEVMGVYATGQFKLNNYTSSSSFSGTAAGYLAFDSSGNVITVAGVASTVTAGFSLTTEGAANNTPSTPSVNAGVYGGVYAFIDLATQNGNGSWIDFSKGNGTDFAGRIRYTNTDDHFGFHTAGGAEKISIGSTGILGFANAVGNKIDFYYTTGDRYGIEVQDSQLKIFSGAGGIASGGILFGKNNGTTFTESLRIRNDGNIQAVGSLLMATSGTSYISMGRFPNSTSNSGEAWLGRASDRSTGSMTVQLGGSSNASFFEVVDYGWTTVTLRVGMNDFSYKGNAVIHAGNIGSQSVSYATSAGNSSTVGGKSVGNSTNNIAYFDGTRNLFVNNPESYSGEVRLGAAWGRGGVYASSTLTMSTSSNNIDFVSADVAIGGFRYDSTNGTRFIVSTTGISTPYTLIDANKRPVIYQKGAYPVLVLDHSETSNTNHGPTIQFAFNGLDSRQWVIGASGNGGRLDFGMSNTAYGNSNFNPHNGIAGYTGKTVMRMTETGVLFGDCGVYPTVNSPSYALQVNGTSYASTYVGGVSGSSYGSIKVSGTSGSYSGIYLSDSSGVVTGMYDTGGNGGDWNPSTGWHFYYHRGNSCFALGGSTTSSSYRVYANGAMYVSGTLTLGSSSFMAGGASYVANGANNSGGFAMNNSGTYWGLMWNYGNNDWRLGYGSQTSQNGWNLRWDGGSSVWVNGTLNTGGTTYSYAYRGNSNVAGTGEAVYAPAGVYSTGTNWLYGTMYVNGNSINDVSNLYGGAYYATNWFRAQGDCGLYSQDYGGHIRRALTGSYGNWETFGYNRNGWSGFLNLNNYNLNLMMNSSGDHGFYIENGPGWTFFFNRANHCAGIGTDNTWSGDGLRAVKQISAEYGFTTWSDRRAKENISDITSALDKVLQMRGVYFNYIKDNAKVKRVGFIAQELQLVLPEVVNYAEEIDEYNVNYGQVVSVLTEATKEQNDMIVSQAARIEQLELLVQQLINSNNGISN